MKLKNINRGLALGAVLAVGVACYTVYDNARFKENKPDIQKTVEGYIDAMTRSSVGSQSDVSKQWCDLLDDYFTDRKGLSEDAETKVSLYDSAVSFRPETDSGDITAAECDVKDVDITKSGADGARVVVSYNVCYNVSKGDPAFLASGGIYSMGSGNYTNSDTYEPSTKPYKAIFNFEYVEMYLIKTSDGWKIVSTSDYGYGEDYTFGDDSSSDASDAEQEITDSSVDEIAQADDTSSAADDQEQEVSSIVG